MVAWFFVSESCIVVLIEMALCRTVCVMARVVSQRVSSTATRVRLAKFAYVGHNLEEWFGHVEFNNVVRGSTLNGNSPVHWEVRSTSVSEAFDNVTSKAIQVVRTGQPSFQGYRRDLDVADVHLLPVQEGLRKRRWPQLYLKN